ncbi:DUF3810 domain-containing protein [Flavobacterium sp. xlx-214]|uniref:DUF3810 domain-containing protein n=1 Tax=unclassified Flavobacterium TaxID=196869 RepID=UPI0013D0F0C5|nr:MULTISPECIES: DUF3810 domain-containing protein [unclassified Flavobacterium]MBA5793725.1 DUF3810 domain-containing protein [Flavobacterium sp. xlx-221]QMI83254.1 DUF3810 domain-containing protein [Flavobacterium sp. xlx-214]
MQKKYLLVIGLLIVVICGYLIAPQFPHFFSTIYNQKIYAGIDYFLHFTTNWLPFSIGDILYAFIVVYLVFKSIKYIKGKEFKKLGLFLTTCILLFFGLFQLMWGFNNYKFSVAKQLDLTIGYEKNDLDIFTQHLISIVNNQQLSLTNNVSKKVVLEKNLKQFNVEAIDNYKKLPSKLQNILAKTEINQVKPSFYSWLQSYMGFSGYFNPFTHENQVNIEIPTIGMPITVAHEMAHQLGIASETEANFFGYQVMKQSDDLQFQYTANLYALKYCLRQYRNENEETYQSLFNQLHYGVQQNITDSEAFWESKRNISSFFFKQLYGRFLKMNNQKDGIQSYNKFVDLLINYNKKFPEIY